MPELSDLIVGVLESLEDETGQMVSARLFAALYELSIRSGKTPRTIADDLFKGAPHDVKWRETTEPFLRSELGRYHA